MKVSPKGPGLLQTSSMVGEKLQDKNQDNLSLPAESSDKVKSKSRRW